MGFVNLKEMAKRAKKTEEEIMELVEIGVIKPQKSYVHPRDFGDGKEIAFTPEEALADIEEAKAKPKPEAPEEEDEEKEEPEEDEATGEPTPESKPEPDPEKLKAEEKAKKAEKKTGKK